MKTNSNDLVYVPMAVDVIHPGHLNIIRVAEKLGSVMVGLLTDEAIASYKRLPYMNYDQRREIVSSLRGVDQVVPQRMPDYEENLRRYKPRYMVHGSDWQKSHLKHIRANAIRVMQEWGGEVVEPDYTPGVSSSALHAYRQDMGIMPASRQMLLKRLLELKSMLRVIEAHNAMSAFVGERASCMGEDSTMRTFDALWLSSLTDSFARGKPDNEVIGISPRLLTIADVLEVTTKPIIFDGDSGSVPQHFAHTVRKLDSMGVSAVIIEDKTGLKRNSLFEDQTATQQESIENFCEKIRCGRSAQVSGNLMIFARIESLILGRPLEEAIERAQAYTEAGADGIMIHSKSREPGELFAFCERYNLFSERRPLVVVPTTYNRVREDELREAGANIVIYANHLLRAAYAAMEGAAESILRHGRAFETESNCITVDALLSLLPELPYDQFR